MKTLLFLLFCASLWAQNPNAAVFPSPATDSTLLVANNFYTTYLSGGISSNATSIPVTTTAGLHLPTAIVIDAATSAREIVEVCGAPNATTLTVCTGGRGFDGTTPHTHLQGVPVTGSPIARMYNQAFAEIKAMEAMLALMMPGPSATGTYCPNYANGVLVGTAQCGGSISAHTMTWNNGTMTWNNGGMTWN